MSKQKRFSKAFKIEAVRQLERGGTSASSLARQLGVKRPQLYEWRDQYRELGENAFSRSGKGNQAEPEKADNIDALKQEIKRLNKALESERLDNEILKKATAYFAKEVK